MINRSFWILISVLTLFASCRPDIKKFEEEKELATDLRTASVGPDFNWTNTSAIQIEFSLSLSNCTSSIANAPLHVRLLNEDGTYLASTISTTNSGQFEFKANYQNTKLFLWIPALGLFQEVGMGFNQINVDCDANGNYDRPRPQQKPSASSYLKSNSFCSECDVIIAEGTTQNDLALEGAIKACVLGTLTGNVELKDGATLSVCGTANVSKIEIKGGVGGFIFISEDGELICEKDINLNSELDEIINNGVLRARDILFAQGASLTNSGTLELTNDFLVKMDGSFVNSGDATFNKDFNINGSFENSGTLNVGVDMASQDRSSNTNNGTINVTRDFRINNPFTNNSEINVERDCKFQSGGEIENNCTFNVTGDFTFNGDLDNNGNLHSGGEVQIQSGADIDMATNTILTGVDFVWNGTVRSTGSQAAITISGNSELKSGAKAYGPLDFCDANGIESNNASLEGNVSYCEVTIKSSEECGGSGTDPNTTDTDNDGVVDGADAEPNNADVAYYEYYPAQGYAFNAFEDLFPSTADYDFNDIVISHRTLFKKNTGNAYVSADCKAVINAAGSGIHNGLGLQFLDYTNNGKELYSRFDQAISGLSGEAEELELGNSNVINVFTNIYLTQSSYYNNCGDGPSNLTPDTVSFSVTFDPNEATVAGSMFPDFFIFRADKRSQEIHLADKPYTSAMDVSVFGTFEDNTNPAEYRYFKTAENLPWGIEIVKNGNFHHPLSKVAITDAYPSFIDWVNSNGASNSDWYLSPVESRVFMYQ